MPQWWCTHRVWPPAWFKQQSSLDVGVCSLSAILWPIHPVTTGHWSLPNTSGLPSHLCLEWENQWCKSTVRLHACVPRSLSTAQNTFQHIYWQEQIQCCVTVWNPLNSNFLPATWLYIVSAFVHRAIFCKYEVEIISNENTPLLTSIRSRIVLLHHYFVWYDQLTGMDIVSISISL